MWNAMNVNLLIQVRFLFPIESIRKISKWNKRSNGYNCKRVATKKKKKYITNKVTKAKGNVLECKVNRERNK